MDTAPSSPTVATTPTPTIIESGPDDERIQRIRSVEPELTNLAIEIFGDGSLDAPDGSGFAAVAERLWARIGRTATPGTDRPLGIGASFSCIIMRVSAHHDARVMDMRTTITLDKDVTAAVERLRRERGVGVSAAVNELVRRGLRPRPKPRRFEQEVSAMGARLDVTNVGDALEILEGPSTR